MVENEKITLFIVEGKSDERALAPAMDEIVKNSKSKFYVVRGDITSDFDSSPENIEGRIKKLIVRKFLDKHTQFEASDIREIIQITDMDGCFIPDSLITEDAGSEIHYTLDRIIAKNKDDFLQSKNNKKRNIIHLSGINKISIPKGIVVPYSIYYMACNLEHVLYNCNNLTDKEKIVLSEKFADEYDDPDLFADFFNDEDIVVHGTYTETWDFIMRDKNSLGRYTNLSVCIDKFRNK